MADIDPFVLARAYPYLPTVEVPKKARDSGQTEVPQQEGLENPSPTATIAEASRLQRGFLAGRIAFRFTYDPNNTTGGEASESQDPLINAMDEPAPGGDDPVL